MLKGQQGIYAYHCLQSWVGNDEEVRGWNDLIQALGPKDNGTVRDTWRTLVSYFLTVSVSVPNNPYATQTFHPMVWNVRLDIMFTKHGLKVSQTYTCHIQQYGIGPLRE